MSPHKTHCCVNHGCKYNDDNCPVENKQIIQEYPCEYCSMEEEENGFVTLPKFIHDNIGFVSLVDKMQNDTALKVVNSARISYADQTQEFGERDKKLCGYLFNHDHTSPFRHSFYTFHIKAPIFTFNQWKKYQVGSTWRTYETDEQTISVDIFDELYDTDKGCSWNEISGRYAKLEPEFYFPEFMRGPTPHNKQGSEPFTDIARGSMILESLKEDCNGAYDQYLTYIDAGVAKEVARMTLPMNIYSQSYWTVSLQGLMHFLDQRLQPDSQQEIQEYANIIYSLVKKDLDKMGIEYNTEI